jgi:hypothetical protein
MYFQNLKVYFLILIYFFLFLRQHIFMDINANSSLDSVQKEELL